MYYFETKGLEDSKSQSDVDTEKLISEMKTLYDEAKNYVKITESDFLSE